jgi:cell division protein ZapA
VGGDEEEEARLDDLAQLVEAKIPALRQRFGEIGDQRLIMAATTLDRRRRTTVCAKLEAELALLRIKAPSAAPDWAEQIAISLREAAQRIEHLAQDLDDSSCE